MRQRQKGFSLLEMLVALGIVAAVIASITLTVTTLLMNSQQPSTQQTLLQQVKSAGHWIPRDINMANDVTPSSPNGFPFPIGFPFTINIPVDQDDNHDYTVKYLIDGNNFKRQEYDSLDILVAETLIAQYVDTDNTIFESITASLYELTIQVSRGEEVVNASYEAYRRLTLD